MSVSITQNAAKQISTQLEKRGKGIGLRLGVKKSGCSGLAYVLDYADELGTGDVVYEDFNVKVIVNNADIEILNGIQLDYVQEGINAAFKFKNPNESGSCGCGESFAVN